MKAAFLLTIVLVITMLTNLLERRRFQQLEQSFSSIYEDRLMAEIYLFNLYENLIEKQELLETAVNEGIDYSMGEKLKTNRVDREQLIEKYAKTYLTDEEQVQFNNLNSLFDRMDRLEGEFGHQPDATAIPAGFIQRYEGATAEVFSTLSALSDIQTIEGEALRSQSQKLIMGSVSISRFEMTILIFIGLIIQALIFSSRTLLADNRQNPGLN
jgi:hypothetical protein